MSGGAVVAAYLINQQYSLAQTQPDSDAVAHNREARDAPPPSLNYAQNTVLPLGSQEWPTCCIREYQRQSGHRG